MTTASNASGTPGSNAMNNGGSSNAGIGPLENPGGGNEGNNQEIGIGTDNA